MIYINLEDLELPQDWLDKADELTKTLLALPAGDRNAFINDDRNRQSTWGDRRLVEALSRVVGHKCWYSEVPLDGQDPNIDHFRPKGRVIGITADPPYEKTGDNMDGGYWWLAFQWKNYRLASMHANQRRVDNTTAGGKSDYFPVVGTRANENTQILDEDVVPLDPCVLSDMELIWFDPDGRPGFSGWKRQPSAEEVRRLQLSTWLYHLDKINIVKARTSYVSDIQKDIITANTYYKMWNPQGPNINRTFKTLFNELIAKMKKKISDKAAFAGAKRCAVKTAAHKYRWIIEFNLI